MEHISDAVIMRPRTPDQISRESKGKPGTVIPLINIAIKCLLIMYCYIHRSVNHSTLPEKFPFALSGQHVDSKTLEYSAPNGSLYHTLFWVQRSTWKMVWEDCRS